MNEQVYSYLKNKYGNFTPVRLIGGYTNETFLLNGLTPSLVVKVANSLNKDIPNEINCLKITQKTGLVPRIYEFANIDNFQITVMEYRQGKNGQSILDNNDIERTKELYRILGSSLSNSIHTRKYNFVSYGIRQSNVNNINLNLDFVPEILVHKSKDILRKVNDDPKEWVLTHGDYGIHFQCLVY